MKNRQGNCDKRPENFPNPTENFPGDKLLGGLIMGEIQDQADTHPRAVGGTRRRGGGPTRDSEIGGKKLKGNFQ